MKIRAFCALLLLLGGCSSSMAPPTTGHASSQWYQVGYHDALAGKIVRDNDTLAEWFGNPQIDRDAYLQGYLAGQEKLCQAATVRALGIKGVNFPASCDGTASAESLKQQWQQGIDAAQP